MRRSRGLAWVPGLTLCILLVVACQATGRNASGEEATASQEDRAVRVDSSLSTYLLLGRDTPPYSHQLLRVESACLRGPPECSPAEIIEAYPGEGVTPSHLHWAPDGSRALMLDTFEPRILQLDATNDHVEILASNVPTIADELTWLPDGRAVLVIQGSEEYTSDLVALDLTPNVPRVESLFQFDGVAFLLGSTATGSLLVRIDAYGVPQGYISGKEEVVDVRLVEADPITQDLVEYAPHIDWFSHVPRALLPDGHHLIVDSGGTELWDLNDGTKLALAQSAIWPAGSPDGDWLAFMQQANHGLGFALTLLELATGTVSQSSDLPVAAKPFWSPDSSLVVLAQLGLDSSAELGSWLVVDIETGIVTRPPTDFGAYPLVLDVSWGRP